MSARTDFAADRARYGGRPWLSDRTIYAIAAMRVGQWIDESTAGLTRKVLRQAHATLGLFVMAFTGVEIARGARVGPGLRIIHGIGVVIGPETVIGSNCSILHGATFGMRSADGGSPTVGDDVEVGTNALILGNVTVGDGAHIGAAAVVLHDVPPRAQVIGNPARIARVRPVGE